MTHFLINSLKGGGAERLVLNICKEFDQADILITEPRIDYPTDSVSIVTLTGIWNRFKYGGIPFAALRLKNYVQENELVIVSLFRSFLLIYLFSFLRNIKYICWVHNDTKIYVKNPLVKWLYKKIFLRASKIVVNSQKAKKDLSNLALCKEEKVEVIYNYLDFQRIHKLKEEPVEKAIDFQKETIFIAAGRLHKIKGFNHLIEAFALASQKGMKAKLVILGDGEERERLLNKIEALKLSKQVLLLGFKKNPYPYIKNSKALLFSSLSEGFGNTILESIICGTPVISTDIDSGPREILSKKENYLFRTKAVEFANFGILMPAFDNDSAIEIWANTLLEITNKRSLLEDYKNLDLNDLDVFSDEKIIQQWKEIITL